MTEQLLPCPFCGGKAETIEHNTLLGKSYSIRCENHCVVTCGHYRRTTGMWRDTSLDEAVEMWNNRIQPANEPLTLDELKQIDGEPVYVIQITGCGEWNFRRDGGISDWYGAWMTDEDICYDCYGKTWTAYRSKPQEGAK